MSGGKVLYGLLLMLVLGAALFMLSCIVAIGLREQRNWARIVVIVLHSLSIVIIALPAINRLHPALVAGWRLVGIAISAWIVIWFAVHKEYFR
jgi:hypothetical protein